MGMNRLEAPAIFTSKTGEFSFTESARKLLGLPADAAPTKRLVEQSLGAAGAELMSAISALIKTGRGFTRVLETSEGSLIEATGRPRGLDGVILLSDQTEVLSRLHSAEKQLAIARDEAKMLRDAMRRVDVAAWSKTPGAWVEITESGLSHDEQSRLIEAADPAGPRRVSLDRDGYAAGYQTTVASGDETLLVAKRITEVLETERLMNRLVHTMSETFAHLSIGLMIFDDRNRLTLFNPAIVELFSEKPEWLATRPRLNEILDQWRRLNKLPHRLDYSAWRSRFLEFGEDDAEASFQETWHLGDGRSLRVLCRRHPSGGIALVIEDITESISLRRSSESERAVRSVTTDLLNEGLIVIGPDGRVKMMNEAFRTLWRLEEVETSKIEHVSTLARTCGDRMETPEYWETLGAIATSGAGRQAGERKLATIDGRTLMARASAMPDGSTLAVFTDISATETIAEALKQRNQALEHAEEMRSALVDQISHRMRTPLNSIYGFGQILSDERFGALNGEQREYVSGIVASSSELVEVIDELSDLISVGSESADVNLEAFDLRELFEDVVKMVEVRTSRRRIVVNEIGAEEFEGRRIRIRQVLFNLLVDALEQTGEDAEIVCDLGVTDGGLKFAVSFQASRPGDELALSLARRAITLDGGEFSIDDAADGCRTMRARIPEVVDHPILKIAAQA